MKRPRGHGLQVVPRLGQDHGVAGQADGHRRAQAQGPGGGGRRGQGQERVVGGLEGEPVVVAGRLQLGEPGAHGRGIGGGDGDRQAHAVEPRRRRRPVTPNRSSAIRCRRGRDQSRDSWAAVGGRMCGRGRVPGLNVPRRESSGVGRVGRQPSS